MMMEQKQCYCGEKEWWVALFIEKNGGWHFAVTLVSLDPRIHDRFTADTVKFTIVIIPVF